MRVFGVEIFLLSVEFIVENDGAGCEKREEESVQRKVVKETMPNLPSQDVGVVHLYGNQQREE